MNKGLVIGIGVLLLAIFLYAGTSVSYGDGEVRLRNQIGAQQKSNEVVYDTAWKVVQQKAQVADHAKDSFVEAFVQMAQARYQSESDGLLVKWVQESNPQFDLALFKDLSSAIEAHRVSFAREQQELIDLKREHDDMRQTFLGSWFVGNRPEIVITVVTSSKTEATFTTKKEDDVNVFGGK